MRSLALTFPAYDKLIPIVLASIGIFIGFANPIYQFPLFVLFLPAVLFRFSLLPRKQAFISGWLAGAMGYSAALYWLYHPITNVGQLPLFLAIPCIMLLGSFLGLFTGLATQIFINLRKALAHDGKLTKVKCLFIGVLGGLAIGGIEQLTGWLLTGFPWFPMSAAFTVWPVFIQLASVVGTYGLSSIFAALSIFLTMSTEQKTYSRLTCLIAAISLLLLIYIFGTLRLAGAQVPEQQFRFLLVQGNVDQNQKWDKASTLANVEHYIALTEQGLADANRQVDMIIWPETALPYVFDYRRELSAMVLDLAKKEGTPLAFGTLGYKSPEATNKAYLFNRVQIFIPEENKSLYYDKRHLVPFGEYIPFAMHLTFLENIMQGIEFHTGNTPYTLPISLSSQSSATQKQFSEVTFGPLICYEAIFPEMAQKMVEHGASMFLVISNDGWFGDTSAPHQHLALSAMRSVEQYRPMVRATNTGITASIDKYGRITKSEQLFMPQAIVLPAETETHTSVFYHWKFFIDGLLWINILLCLALPIILRKKDQ